MGSIQEESPDFIREDTSERLGAVRLRKVSQKTNRRRFTGGQGEMPALRARTYLRKLKKR